MRIFGTLALLALPLLLQAAGVTLVLVDETGSELVSQNETVMVGLSDPQPDIKLDPVSIHDVQLVDGGRRLRVTVSGEVTDRVADVVADRKADITEVRVGNQRLPVRRVPEPPSPSRPFAFRGRFQGTATLELSSEPELVLVEAQNALGVEGVASFDVQYETTYTPPETVWTGNDPFGKFFDPFTLKLGETNPGTRDSLVFFKGRREPRPDDAPLTETGPQTLTFQGAARELGDVTFVVERPAQAGAPGERRSLQAKFDSTGLSIWGQEYEFVETAAGSGVFRSPARRLPSNEILEVRVSGFSAGRADSVSMRVAAWQAFAAELVKERYRTRVAELGDALPPPLAMLRETAANSRTFVGDVRGLGLTTFEVRTVEAKRLQAHLTSPVLGLKGLLLVLDGEAGRFRTQGVGTPTIEVGAPSIQARLRGVAMNERPASYDLGRFQPVWVIAKGFAGPAVGAYAEAKGQRFELTTEPLAKGSPAVLRFRLPFLLAERVTRPGLANVVAVTDVPSGGSIAFEPEQLLKELSVRVNPGATR